jgi:hypothetical protein
MYSSRRARWLRECGGIAGRGRARQGANARTCVNANLALAAQRRDHGRPYGNGYRITWAGSAQKTRPDGMTFEPTFSNLDKDIERYLEKYGVRDTLSNGTPVIRGYDKAQRYVLDQYISARHMTL